MSECCRKTFFFLAMVVSTVGSFSYCFYLIWLLVYLKNNEKFWFTASMILSNICLVMYDASTKSERMYFVVFSFLGLLYAVMSTFTELTRQVYYHLSADDLIGPQWVIMSLKGSIVFFVCGFLVKNKCQLQKILEDKDILSRGLLDFVDIFNLVELLSLNKCVGIGSYVTEGSSLEIAIQVFCTMSFVIIFHVIDPFSYLLKRNIDDAILQTTGYPDLIYKLSPIVQNIPFLVIRIIVWAHHGVFSLGFMVKNIWAIVVCCAQLVKKGGVNDEQPNNADEEPDNVQGTASGCNQETFDINIDLTYDSNLSPDDNSVAARTAPPFPVIQDF